MTFGVTRLFVRSRRRFGDLSTNLFTSGLPSATVIVPVACTALHVSTGRVSSLLH